MENTVDWYVVLKIWAVVGTLAAAAASAIWSRRVQIQDRTYERSRMTEARLDAIEDRESEFRRSTLHSHKMELRACLSNFVASSNEFAIACVAYARAEPTDKAALTILSETRSSMNKAFQSVAILANDEIASSAMRLLNLAADTPIMGENIDELREEHTKKYQAARSDLIQLSRKLLGLKDEA